MALSLGLTPLFHQFPRLPYELRLSIIREFLRDLVETKSRPAKWSSIFIDSLANPKPRGPWPRLGKYATIDKQWKSVVEKHTFRSLSLLVGNTYDPNVLDDLERICVQDRVDAISNIDLSISLDRSGIRHTESPTGITSIAIGQDIMADNDEETDVSIAPAEHVVTAAFRRFFQVLKSWSHKRKQLSVTCKFLCHGPRMSRPLVGTHLRIDSSSFPEVACIDSMKMRDGFNWGIQPASVFQLLTKLPNVTDATMTLEDDLESQDLVQCIQEGCSTNSFRASKLKSLFLESTALWYRNSDTRFHSHPSLQLSQSIFAMTSKLEEVYLQQVVDVSAFLRQACVVSENTPKSSPAWPNMKILCVKGDSSSRPSDDPTVADELFDSVTQALPHLPNLLRLEIAVTSPFYVNERCYWDDAIIYMQVPPRDDRSAMRDGMLVLVGVKPDQETLDTWQEIARSQWHCKLARVP